MKNLTKKIIGMLMALVCIIGIMPVAQVLAADTAIKGGHDSMSDAYSWGAYSKYKSIYLSLPEGQNDIWVKFTLSSGSKIYAKSSYNDKLDQGMIVEMKDSRGNLLDDAYSPDNIYGMDSVSPFMAVKCDNDTSSTQTYYIHLSRGSNTSNLSTVITLNERIKTGRGEFKFSGTANNTGNKPVSLAGKDSSVLSLNLKNDTSIPPEAVVTSVKTSGIQSPSQGNVRHMILPSSNTSVWYTAEFANSANGSYTIDKTDAYEAKQVWQFKYNTLASVSSTMKSVKLTLEWEYDISKTNYEMYK